VVKNNVILYSGDDRSDNGAIHVEMLSTAADATNNVLIEDNYVADYGSDGNYGQCGIYLDEGSNHVTVTGNVIGPPLEGSVSNVNDSAEAITVAGPDNTITNNIIDLGDSGGVFVANMYGYSTYGEQGNVISNNIVLSDFSGAQWTNMGGTAGDAYYQNIGPASNYTIQNNDYWNYASGGAVFSNGVLAGDASPLNVNPEISGLTYTIAAGSPVLSGPMNFAPIAGNWGPTGFVIPNTGTTLSDSA
jgi:hypothetical protein